MQAQTRTKNSCAKRIILAGLLLFPAISKAEITCPWLNEATASGILDYPASLKVQNTIDNGINCAFFSRKQSSIDNLQITVYEGKDSSMSLIHYQEHCSSSVRPLKAIGNEAELCSFGGSGGERVVGRVRDRIFIISLRVDVNRDLLQKKIENVAEQTAGALF
jgi:hypothetical protein